MKRVKLLLLTLVFVGGCATHSIGVDDLTGPETWGAATNVMHLKHLYFSEQPDSEALQVAKSRGVTTVISLRDPTEHSWNEAQEAGRSGLKFINVPVAKNADSLSHDAILAVDAAVKAQKGEPVLLHCSSGNRAAAWLATHLVFGHQMDVEKSIGIARKAGLTKKGMEKRVRTYIRAHQPDAQ